MEDDKGTVVWLHEHIAKRRPDLPDIRATRADTDYRELDAIADLGETAMRAVQTLQELVALRAHSNNEVAKAVLDTIYKMSAPLPGSVPTTE